MDELKVELARLTAEIERLKGLETRVSETEAALATAQAQVIEKSTEVDALKATLAAQAATVTDLEGKLTVADTKVAEITAKEVEASQVARYAERLAKLPEGYRTALSKRPEADQKLFEARWTVASDEAFDAFVSDLGIVNTATYLAMSRAEGGRIPNEKGEGSVRSMLRRKG